MAKKGKNKFKKTSITPSDLFKYEFDDSLAVMPNYDYPVFCFKHLHPDYDLKNCDSDELTALMHQLANLSKLTWQKLTLTQRHGMGSEKIYISQMAANCPDFITEDVDFLLAFRFIGKKPFLVHRNRFICHVLFIDNKFSLYNHG